MLKNTSCCNVHKHWVLSCRIDHIVNSCLFQYRTAQKNNLLQRNRIARFAACPFSSRAIGTAVICTLIANFGGPFQAFRWPRFQVSKIQLCLFCLCLQSLIDNHHMLSSETQTHLDQLAEGHAKLLDAWQDKAELFTQCYDLQVREESAAIVRSLSKLLLEFYRFLWQIQPHCACTKHAQYRHSHMGCSFGLWLLCTEFLMYECPHWACFVHAQCGWTK